MRSNFTILSVFLDEERIERPTELRLYGAILGGDGPLNHWGGFITNLERERPGFQQKAPPGENGLPHFLPSSSTGRSLESLAMGFTG